MTKFAKSECKLNQGGGCMLKISLKSARVNAGLTQKDAAAKLGVSNKTLGSWESGTSFPSANKIEMLCSLYGVNYDNIIFLPEDSLKAK